MRVRFKFLLSLAVTLISCACLFTLTVFAASPHWDACTGPSGWNTWGSLNPSADGAHFYFHSGSSSAYIRMRTSYNGGSSWSAWSSYQITGSKFQGATPPDGYVSHICYQAQVQGSSALYTSCSHWIDLAAPVYSSVSVRNVNADGYDVYIYGVNDNDPNGTAGSGINRVQCPTWTSANGQDDIVWGNATNLGGGTWYYHVTRHGSEYIGYNTHVYIYDNVGNYAFCVATSNLSLDTTPPSITFNPYSFGWTNSTRYVTINCTDNESGMDYFYYYIIKNGGYSYGGTVYGTTATVALSADGVYSLYAVAYDNAGNMSSEYSGSYYIDKTPPTCAVSATSDDWRTGASPVTLTYSDDASGVATKQYSWSQSTSSPGSWQSYTGQVSSPGSGVWYLWWRATDVAGNVGAGYFGPYTATAELTIGIQTPNAAYLTDTDVITSVRVSDSSAASVLPGDSAVLNYTVIRPDGTVYTTQSKAVVCPANGGNLLWFRWHTPTAADTYTLKASLTAAGVTPRSGWSNTLAWNIKVPTENAPPQTTLYDIKPSWFSIQMPNPCGYSSVLSWSDWIYTGGAFQKRTYSATLNAALTVTPTKAADGSNRIVTAVQDASGKWTLKSGYGISESVACGVTLSSSTGSVIDNTSATTAQLAEGRYPEFNYYYAGYFRLFDCMGNGSFQLKQNPYSQYGFRTHYVPIWFPDGTYTALATISQAWTPAGMLGTDTTGTVQISGALPDDWYVKVQ